MYGTKKFFTSVKAFSLAVIVFHSIILSAAQTDFIKVLHRSDIDDLYDINMNCRWLRDNQIGFSNWYKTADRGRSFTRQYVEKSVTVTLLLNDKPVKFGRLYNESFWQPDKMRRVHIGLAGAGVKIRQELAIFNDQTGYLVKLSGLKGKTGTLTVTLKSMGQGKGSVKNNLVTFDIDRDYHKGFTHCFAVSLPQTSTAEIADVSVTPYPAGYSVKDKIDTESRAVITVPVDGQQEEIEFFLISALVKTGNTIPVDELQKKVKNPEAFFSSRLKEWQDYFNTAVPELESSDIRLLQFYAWNYYIFKANTYLDHDNSPYYICPSKEWSWLPLNWDEDSAHIISGARWLNSPAQLKMMENMFFHFMQNSSPLSYGLMTMAGWEYYLRTGDKEFLQKAYDAIKNIRKRYTKNMRGDLIIQRNSFLIGWDDSLRYAWGGYNKNLRNFERQIMPVDLNSYLVRECQIMAEAAIILGKPEEAAFWKAQADKTSKEIQRLMWDENSGFYYDIFADDHTKLMCKASSGFTPMCAGIPNRKQAEKMLKLLKDPGEFGSRYAIPTLAVSEPKRGNNWSGDIAGRNNWLVEQGLARYDRDSSAWITEKTVELFMRREGARAGGYIKPDKLTENHRLFVTEIAGGLDMVIRHIIGFTPETDGFSILPAALDKNMDHLRWQIEFRGKQIEIYWDRPNGDIKFSGIPEGYSVLIDGQRVFNSKSIPTVRKNFPLK